MKPSTPDLFALKANGMPQTIPEPVLLGELLFQVEVPGRLPSWNEILGMEQWARYQFKKELAAAFLCELRRSAADSLTRTISARSTMLTCAATLERYLLMRQEQRKLKSASKKRNPGKKSLSGSKSLKDSKQPPF